MVFADSVSTKNDLQELLGFDEQKVIVAYPGVEDIEISDIDLEHTKNKFQLKPNYILAVGKVEPRKNLQRLIEAFDLLENTDTELVIVGPPGWASIDHTVKNVRFLGYVSDQELYALYHLANFFIFPSLYEGFGYPLVEAMKIGCPTAASNTSSLKEIGENASLLFDPTNVDDIKNALETLTNDKELCQELVTKGRKKAHEYTWKRYYDELITSLERYT
jgi:glycosyltransferase involved in cell wall biosynthesis